VTHSNAWQLVDTDTQHVTLNMGKNRKYTVAAI